MSKINFKKDKKIYYFNTIPSKKYFEKQCLPYFQTPFKAGLSCWKRIKREEIGG
jgi:hypothetical protein